jgi:hypothetical protein
MQVGVSQPPLNRGLISLLSSIENLFAPPAWDDRFPALRWKRECGTAVTDNRHSPAMIMKTTRAILGRLTRSAAATLFGLATAHAADNTAPAGFAALFNGQDFTGWTVPAGDNGHWKIVDGVIDYDARSEAKGDKSLWSEREFGDFILHMDWRIKQTPYVNPNVPYILPDGTHARDTQGKEMKLALPDSDSGIFLRGSGRFQVNIWCWPIGSGEMYGIRTDPKTSAELRAAVTPRTQADSPVGQWNHFEITVRGKTVSVVLNGKLVLPGAMIPDLPARGRLALQHHGAERDGKWIGPPSLLQLKNIYIKELN